MISVAEWLWPSLERGHCGSKSLGDGVARLPVSDGFEFGVGTGETEFSFPFRLPEPDRPYWSLS